MTKYGIGGTSLWIIVGTTNFKMNNFRGGYMTIYQFPSPEGNLAIIKATLKHNEHIACTNATVLVDDDGNITGWVDNNKTLPYIVAEN